MEQGIEVSLDLQMLAMEPESDRGPVEENDSLNSGAFQHPRYLK